MCTDQNRPDFLSKRASDGLDPFEQWRHLNILRLQQAHFHLKQSLLWYFQVPVVYSHFFERKLGIVSLFQNGNSKNKVLFEWEFFLHFPEIGRASCREV